MTTPAVSLVKAPHPPTLDEVLAAGEDHGLELHARVPTPSDSARWGYVQASVNGPVTVGLEQGLAEEDLTVRRYLFRGDAIADRNEGEPEAVSWERAELHAATDVLKSAGLWPQLFPPPGADSE